MPADLDIDHTSPIANTMPHYAEQVIVCTGKEDWTSKIEEEDGETGQFVRGLRGAVGLGQKGQGSRGAVFDPFHNISILTSSFSSSSAPETASAYLFPSFKYVPSITNSSLADFATAFLKAEKLHPAHDKLPAEQKKALLRNPELQGKVFPRARDVEDVVVLICGHGGRDRRCGVLGPMLRDEFKRQFERKAISVSTGEPKASESGKKGLEKMSAKIGLISHIGGHKFAGNVIIYVPPALKAEGHALAGTGVWYGRVRPEHVEGIVEETILGGRIIREMFRGGVLKGREGVGRL
ncbi:sucrose cleavage family protein [Delitschia confertaspora ATCC 74209]|uniref:Altered inheritance of mitochondria protein 32 n=1 Tax=Delitschia confertaspora ATCC 74209 TaxID=1513339 RepID=A0A9P4JTP5_9PLEO|nr:sucrose cleavage family protein [Delitschia confertaspora ATCC 74209]